MTSLNVPHIEIENLSKRFSKHVLFDRLALTVFRGESLVLLGESGCGKSTLLRMMIGLEQTPHSHIRVNGIDLSGVAPHRRDMAIVFQTGNGYEHLRVEDNMRLAFQRNTLADASTRNALFKECVNKFEIAPLMPIRMKDLSVGQSQRVSLARAFVSGKRIVLLDEPLAHLDQIRRSELRSIIAEFRQLFGFTMVYVTHDSEEAKRMADRIAILVSGRILQIGTVDEVFNNPQSALVSKLLGISKDHSPNMNSAES